MEIQESKKLEEENKIFDAELKIDKEYKEKTLKLSNQILNIEKDYQSQLDMNFTLKENLKVR